MKKTVQSDLYTLPNIGQRSVSYLEKVGVRSVTDLKKYGPETIYDMLCVYYKTHMHMAFLYVLRAAYSYSLEKIDWNGAKNWWLFRSPNDKDLVLYYKKKFKSNTL